MDFDEFEESDVMFSDYSSDQSFENENVDPNIKHYSHSDGSKLMVMVMSKRFCLKKKPTRVSSTSSSSSSSSSSAPLNIPQMNTSTFRYDLDVARYQPPSDEYNNNDDDDDGDLMMRLPPHLIIERRDNEEIARSFSPLKGKNLCQVRNSILKMTGFLER